MEIRRKLFEFCPLEMTMHVKTCPLELAERRFILATLPFLSTGLNEELVTSLMKRDELFMGQDSMLVDLEDITRHL